MTDGERHATRRDIAGPLRVPGVDPVGIRVRDPRSLGGAIDHECEHRGRIRWDLPVGWRQSHPKPTGAELGGQTRGRLRARRGAKAAVEMLVRTKGGLYLGVERVGRVPVHASVDRERTEERHLPGLQPVGQTLEPGL